MPKGPDQDHPSPPAGNGRDAPRGRQRGARRNVLLLKAGVAAPSVRLRVGDYDRWFLVSLGHEEVRWTVVSAHAGEPLPRDARAFDAILVTGSPQSVTAPEPWALAAAEYLLTAAERKVPVLGVCFGHQLLGMAYGGRVARNPLGREIGTVPVALTPEGQKDPLFEGLAPHFLAQTTHEDHVERVPAGATLLATNAHSTVQALAFGPHVRGVQFHPELEPESMRVLIESRADGLEAAAPSLGLQPGERVPRLLAGIQPTRSGRRILQNFLTHFV